MIKSRMLWAIALFAGTGLSLTALRQVHATHATPRSTDSTNWVRYSAHYTEQVSTRDTSGNETQKQTLKEEFRSDDGDLLTVVKDNGKEISGKLWLADGRKFTLDYVNKKAIETEQSPRRHPFVPPDPTLGAKTISGLNCLIYPIHMHVDNTNGTICVDMGDDIIGEVEIHSDNNGVHQDYVNTLTWIDLKSPIDLSIFGIPERFTKVAPSNDSH